MNLFSFRKKKDNNSHTAKDDMSIWAGAFAHEIKNPLNAIKINVDLIKEDWDKNDDSIRLKSRKRLDTLAEEISRLETIVNDFLRFARLPKPNLEKCNIGILINELLDFTEPEAQLLNISIERILGTDLPEMKIDSNLMKQALMNIILNSYQAMPSGGEIVVKAFKSGAGIIIDISDSGHGIPENKLDRIFDLFYSTKESGTGLGLSITKRIIELHKGNIQVTSKEGKGTTFSIFLPFTS